MTQPKKLTLQEQLAEEKRQEQLAKEDKKTPPLPETLAAKPIDIPMTPQQRLLNADFEIKAFQKESELDSIKAGYESFKLRESSIANREKAVADKEVDLQTQVGVFEIEQKKRLADYNGKVEEYNKAFALLSTERKEANKIMQEALKLKSESENIIKSQTANEKLCQQKQVAYTENMDECLKLMGEIVSVLRREDNGESLNISVLVGKDLVLIEWLKYKKANMQTLADVIAVDCERITELCEHLQDSKKDNGAILKYLLDSTAWIEQALKLTQLP